MVYITYTKYIRKVRESICVPIRNDLKAHFFLIINHFHPSPFHSAHFHHFLIHVKLNLKFYTCLIFSCFLRTAITVRIHADLDYKVLSHYCV
jgi:hypothetical protein